MSEPKYKIGDSVYYFDSFNGTIVGTTVKSYKQYHLGVKTPGGDIITRQYFIGEYELSNGVLIKEPLLFDAPMVLVDHYLVIFEKFKHFKFEGIH